MCERNTKGLFCGGNTAQLSQCLTGMYVALSDLFKGKKGNLCPLHIEVLGFLTCIKVLLDVISKLALRGIFEGVFNL